MTEAKPTIYGQLEGRSLAASMLTFSLVLSLAFALPNEAAAQAWELEREKGVGGGGAAAPAAPAVPRQAIQERAGSQTTRATPPTASELLEKAEPLDRSRRAILPPPPDAAPGSAIEVVAIPVILPSPPKPALEGVSVQPVLRSAAAADGTAEVPRRSAALATEGTVTDGEVDGAAAVDAAVAASVPIDIHVRFVEVNRSDMLNLGIDWSALVDSGGFRFGRSTGNVDDVGMDAFIDALAREEIVDVLAEPDLNATEGEVATTRIGGQIPVFVPGGDGRAAVALDEKPVGVSLDIEPAVSADRRIDLRVRPQVSSISAARAVVVDGFPVPAFTAREVETDADLSSGQTVAIAGLFQGDLAPDLDAFPALGDLPVLGELFRSERFQRDETELVVLITPYLTETDSERNIAAQ